MTSKRTDPKPPETDLPENNETPEDTLPLTPPEEEEGPEDAAKKAAAKKAGGKKGKEKTAPPEPIPGLTEGRIVHYVLDYGHKKGEHRAAMVVYVHDHGSGLVDLLIFTRKVDFPASDHPGHTWFKEKVPFSKIPQEDGHWHWIEKS